MNHIENLVPIITSSIATAQAPSGSNISSPPASISNCDPSPPPSTMPPSSSTSKHKRLTHYSSCTRVFQSLLTLLSVVIHVTSAKSAASIMSSVDYRYFVAGGSCAAISHGITTPIDVVKTRMQSDPEKYESILPATALIIKEEGPGALTSGLGPTLVGYGIEGALKFGVYEVSKPLVVAACRSFNDKATICGGPLPFLVASILGGAVASLVLVPMESVRIRMVTDPKFEGVGMLKGLGRLVEEAGLAKTLTVGMGAMLAKQVPYTFGKQVSFDVVAKFLYRLLHAPRETTVTLAESLSKTVSPESMKWMVSVLAAMVASVMACLMSQPGDVILTETYKGDDHDGKKKQSASQGEREIKSLREISTSIYSRRNSLSGFFTGLQARFVHVGMIITSQLVIYDIIKQLLGLPATGSH